MDSVFFEDNNFVPVEVKIEPLEGRYNLEAIRALDIKRILTPSFQPNQMHQMALDEEREYWLKIADVLGVADGGDEYRLRMVLEYLAVRHPNQWCPCRNGFLMRSSDHHLRECEIGEQQGIEEIRTRERLEALRRRDEKERRLADMIQEYWSPRVAQYLIPGMMIKVAHDCRKAVRGLNRL